MKIIAEHQREDELKVADIVQKLISKHKLPLFTNTIYINKYSEQKHSPRFTLNTNHLRNGENLILVDLVHLNLALYSERIKPIRMTILLNKFKHDFHKKENSKVRGEVTRGLKVFIKYLVIVFNEINIIREIIKPGSFKSIYGSYVRYPLLTQWILDNFDRIKKALEENDLVWKNKIQIQKPVIIEKEDILPEPIKKKTDKKVQELKDAEQKLKDESNIDIKNYPKF